jgi:HK97 gp10 family phage protein
MAASTGVTIRVVSNNFPAASAAIHAAVVTQVAVSTYDVEARSKQLAPVLTGTLRRSIHSVFEQGGLRGICGPSVVYGFFVEFGTRRRAARPYMRPAAEYVLPRFVEQLRRLLAGRP